MPAPDPTCIPPADILGVTIVLLTCSYRSSEFIRVGYYVNNEHPDHAPAPDDQQGEDAELTVADDGDAEDEDDDDDDDMEVEDAARGAGAGPPSTAKPANAPPAAAAASAAAAAAPAKPATGAATPTVPVLTKMPEFARITRVISSEPTVTRFPLKHWDEPASGTLVDPELSGDVTQNPDIPVQ